MMKSNESLIKMKSYEDKEQLIFMLNNINLFIDDPVFYLLAVSDTLQTNLSYVDYLHLLHNQALKKRHVALLKASNEALFNIRHLNI